MINLAFILHMHQPYYKNLLTGESELPGVRLHGIKDYLDMALILEDVPGIHLTFNIVPCLLEQIEDYASGRLTDKYLTLSYKKVGELTSDEKYFIREHFFSANLNRVIGVHPNQRVRVEQNHLSASHSMSSGETMSPSILIKPLCNPMGDFGRLPV